MNENELRKSAIQGYVAVLEKRADFLCEMIQSAETRIAEAKKEINAIQRIIAELKEKSPDDFN